MFSKCFWVFIISITLILFNCQFENQPTQLPSDEEVQNLDKKIIKGEWITFTGDLSGSQQVLGCCPNAGPFPAYTMTLSGEELPNGTYDGEIFMNILMTGKGKNKVKSYIVQFWTNALYLEVRGGVIQEDKINKITTVTFTDETCEIDVSGEVNIVTVSFTLIREQL